MYLLWYVLPPPPRNKIFMMGKNIHLILVLMIVQLEISQSLDYDHLQWNHESILFVLHCHAKKVFQEIADFLLCYACVTRRKILKMMQNDANDAKALDFSLSPHFHNLIGFSNLKKERRLQLIS